MLTQYILYVMSLMFEFHFFLINGGHLEKCVRQYHVQASPKLTICNQQLLVENNQRYNQK